MTEITRVPLRPIAKGSLTKLWIGVIVAIALAVLLAWSLAPQGYGLTVLEEGTGPTPEDTDVAFVKYVGRLDDGTVFDESQPLPIPVEGIFPEGNPLPIDGVVPGFAEGLKQMQAGGRYRGSLWCRCSARQSDPAQCGPDLRGRTRRLHEPCRIRPPHTDHHADDAAAGRDDGCAGRRCTYGRARRGCPSAVNAL